MNAVRLNIDDVFESENQKYFRVLEELGEGGFGTTYLVKEEGKADEFVAKIPLIKEEKEDEYRIRKQKHEAKILKELQNSGVPNVVEYFDDFNTTINNYDVPVLLMQKASGVTLKEFQSQTQNYRLKESLVKEICVKVGEALVGIHKLGIIHRDIKPENIFIDGDEQNPVITLIDFGIAAYFDQSVALNEATNVGTAFFSPPEQNERGIVAPSADVFGLGATAFLLTAGRKLSQPGRYEPCIYADDSKGYCISQEFSDVIVTATWPEMTKRYATVEDFISAIQGRPPIKNTPRIVADGKEYPLIKDHMVIGRKNSTANPPPDIEVAEYSQPGYYFLSRRHAEIKNDADGFLRLYDGFNGKPSTNGTVWLGRGNKWFKVPPGGIPLGNEPIVIGLGFADQPTGKKDRAGNEILPGVYRTIEYRPPDTN